MQIRGLQRQVLLNCRSRRPERRFPAVSTPRKEISGHSSSSIRAPLLYDYAVAQDSDARGHGLA
eukprot:6151159-Heterocapsa_arctica.AAC.1